MIKRKLTSKRVLRREEIEYYDTIQKERKEVFLNKYYEDNKIKLSLAIIFTSVISAPYILSKKIYNYVKNKNNIVHPEIQ